MPVLLARDHALHWPEQERLRLTLCPELAVQPMPVAQIASLARGVPAGPLSLLCCSVARVADADTAPLWLAAVTPNERVCSVDEVLLVPLSAACVREALLNALLDRREADTVEMAMARRLVLAQRTARALPLLSLSALKLDRPRDLACSRTCAALLSVHVPLKRLGTPACAEPTARGHGFEFDLLHDDVQLLVAVAHLLDSGSLAALRLRLVNRFFRDVVDSAMLLMGKELRDAVCACDTTRLHSVGGAVARMGARPLRVLQCKPLGPVRVT
jgi:hypothetical protein